MRLLSSLRSDRGSMPIALLGAIVVAGIVSVITARAVAGERAVRFDRSFTESFHVSDAGVQQAVFQLNAGAHESMDVGDTLGPIATTFDNDSYVWTLERTGGRSWTVTSTGTQDGVSRTVQASITEQPLFFPGAFGDTLIALNGASTNVDSYNSGSCVTPASDCKWGTDPTFGTGNGSIGTNGVFDFSGNPAGSLREGSAFLYDWEDNPGQGITVSEPFGDRCTGVNACTTQYVTTVDERLDFSSDANMAFIHEKLANCGGPGQELGAVVYKKKDKPSPLKPYDPSAATGDPRSPLDGNYYCADSLQVDTDLALDATATADEPVVIFVRDFITVGNQVTIACEDVTGGDCPKNPNDISDFQSPVEVRPVASRLQIFVAADEPGGGKKGANVTYEAGSKFAGVVYAPRSRCGSPGGASVHIFGAIICGSMDNVGNWNFHYDDQLGKFGTGSFGVGYYTEEPSIQVTPTP